MRAHSGRKWKPIREYKDTAYCPVHQMLEPFRIKGDADIAPAARRSVHEQGGRIVSVEFLCGESPNRTYVVAA